MTPAPPLVTQLQVSGRDDEGLFILSALAKRTYLFGDDQSCALAKEQIGLVLEPEYNPDKPGVLLADMDVWPYKKQTDVVVLGKAYNHRLQPSFVAGIRIGRFEKALNVFGNRQCTLDPGGRIVFSKPTVLPNVPLSYEFAYGGRDHVTESKHGNPIDDIREFFPSSEFPPEILDQASAFAYPRNPVGRGYLVEVSKEAVEALSLPNLEYGGEQRLGPDNLSTGAIDTWTKQPLPASLGWLDYRCFPRLAWLGVLPEHKALHNPSELHEIRLGYASAGILGSEDQPHIECANGASLGLRLPYLAPGESVELLNLHPTRERVRFQLPRERPGIWIDGRNGKMVPTQPIIHSVIVEPDENRLCIVWRGSGKALRPYLDHEIDGMPFRVEW
jgi:hypothetical protein